MWLGIHFNSGAAIWQREDLMNYYATNHNVVIKSNTKPMIIQTK